MSQYTLRDLELAFEAGRIEERSSGFAMIFKKKYTSFDDYLKEIEEPGQIISAEEAKDRSTAQLIATSDNLREFFKKVKEANNANPPKFFIKARMGASSGDFTHDEIRFLNSLGYQTHQSDQISWK